MLIIGHRGAAGLAPENTMAAIAAGIEAGSDMIEIDVRLTRDNQLVVLGLGKTQQSLTYDPVAKTFKTRAEDKALRDLGVAYFQTAADLFKTNRYN